MEPGQPTPDPQPVQFGSYAELYDQAVDNLNQIPKYRNADGILFVCALQTEIKRLQNRQIDKSLTRDPRDKKAVLNAEGIEPQPGPRVKDLKTVRVGEIMPINSTWKRKRVNPKRSWLFHAFVSFSGLLVNMATSIH